jgi:hypothetical protein
MLPSTLGMIHIRFWHVYPGFHFLYTRQLVDDIRATMVSFDMSPTLLAALTIASFQGRV